MMVNKNLLSFSVRRLECSREGFYAVVPEHADVQRGQKPHL